MFLNAISEQFRARMVQQRQTISQNCFFAPQKKLKFVKEATRESSFSYSSVPAASVGWIGSFSAADQGKLSLEQSFESQGQATAWPGIANYTLL
jgi:hypothetical protein